MKRLSCLIAPVIAAIAGALTVFAFAPFRLWPLQIVCLAVLIGLTLRAPKPRHAFFTGWAYSAGSLAAGLHWLYISLHQYGGMAAPMAVAAIILLALFLGLFAALACSLTRFFMTGWRAGENISALLLFPAFWTFADWIRGWIATGLPWLVTGYAHTDSPLAGYAPILGVYGLSFLGALAAGILTVLALNIRRQKHFLTTGIVAMLALLAIGWLLKTVPWTRPHGDPIHVRLLQGNIPQAFKFTPEQIQHALARYTDIILAKPADLIVTPETAIPIYPHEIPTAYFTVLAEYAAKTGSHLALGIPLMDTPLVYTNSLVVMAPTDRDKPIRLSYRYNKHHLVPFGEFVPMGFRWFVNLMHIPLGDFTAGDTLQKPFHVKDQWILPNICYEDLFGEEIADQIRHEYRSGHPTPTLLLNVSNIAWFGHTIALPQHLQISQMRAMETGRPMLRATNTGVTAVINEKGLVLGELPAYIEGELDATLRGTRGATPYIRFGNLTILLIALASLVAARWLSARHPR